MHTVRTNRPFQGPVAFVRTAMGSLCPGGATFHPVIATYSLLDRDENPSHPAEASA
ncbi:MAG: hypothetical protein M3Z16_05060 [Pseudomonadota bacterium]|nr:hypothetical protein [Pseudomonadota bacterium]